MSLRKNRMAKLVTLTAAVLLLTIATTKGNRIRPLVSNLIAEDETLPQCHVIMENIKLQESLAYAPYPPDTRGTWVSQECETRPGPEFLLRHYHFERDQSFRMLQHFYADEWCTTPVYTIVARGQLQTREPSWLVPGATDADYVLSKVSVIAYSDDVLDDISKRVNKSCPGYVTRSWRSHKEYLIYSYTEDSNDMELVKRQSNASGKRPSYLRPKRVSHNGSQYHQSKENQAEEIVSNETVEEMDCLSAFHAVFHELQLIRSVRRPHPASKAPQKLKSKGKPNEKKYQSFLYLGDIHPSYEHRAAYRPTAYQRPLVRPHEVPECHVCHTVSKSTEKSPPHLHAQPRLPVYPIGDWVSTQCEVQSIGMFVTRHIRMMEPAYGFEDFHARPSFQALFHYFMDPTCETATFSVMASGTYFTGHDSDRMKAGTNHDFVVEKVVITPHDIGTAQNLNGLKGNMCGIDGSWQVNVPQDVSKTSGCSGLGIKVPSTARDILKMDLDAEGHSMLYFGVLEGVGAQHSRPTHYLPPLVHCNGKGSKSFKSEMNNELLPTFYARTSDSPKSKPLSVQTWCIVGLLSAHAIYRENL